MSALNFLVMFANSRFQYFSNLPRELKIVLTKEFSLNHTFVHDYIHAWLLIQDNNPDISHENFDLFYDIAFDPKLHYIVLGVSKKRCETEWPDFFTYGTDLKKDILCYILQHDELNTMDIQSPEDSHYMIGLVSNLIKDYNRIICEIAGRTDRGSKCA